MIYLNRIGHLIDVSQKLIGRTFSLENNLSDVNNRIDVSLKNP